MPELPEVQTHVDQLAVLVGQKFAAIESDTPKMFHPSFSRFQKMLVGRTIRAVMRRGKYLLFQLDVDYLLVAHFRMTGHFLLGDFGGERFLRACFTFASGQKLYYQDMRKFGCFHLGKTAEVRCASGLDKLGPEPLEVDLAEFSTRLLRSTKALKALLLDQSFVAGVGNIYADEALFAAGLSPLRKAKSLKTAEVRKLYDSMQKVLQAGIANKGSSIGEYVDLYNQPGKNQNHVQAYGKRKGKCPKCGGDFTWTVVAQRGTTYCPHCQK